MPPISRAAVVDQIRRYETEMVDTLSALIAIPSENPPGSRYRECREELQRQLQALGLTVEVLRPDETDDEALSIRSVFGSSGPVVYFHGHYDVVPAFQPEQFTPSIRNGHVFGRGSADMKGGLVSMMYAVRALKELGAELNGRIALMFVPDEETGGRRGTARLARHKQFEADALAMFTAEPTSGVIWHACRGAISIRITVKGNELQRGARRVLVHDRSPPES
jgi:succinyl-diaminopimelate desuccinylase